MNPGTWEVLLYAMTASSGKECKLSYPYLRLNSLLVLKIIINVVHFLLEFLEILVVCIRKNTNNL